MARPKRIPLFPLDLVLMPGAELPLHIFEPRYKVMIARCLEEKLEFGLILAANQSVATMGCTAEIVQKIREYPDGRMDILTAGRAVFHLIELIEDNEYYEATVEYAVDDTFARDSEQEVQLVQLFDRCHAQMFGRPSANPGDLEPEGLAYRLAAMLPVELEKRQALLETRSERDRRELLLRWMERFLPKLIAQQRARERALRN
ncbi:MAG TPA: LON peptidase substrate-binding domain-containing protein [Candidatus Acidoferrales bacterium]|nr:LON peptidase substrate-binding domain-containing protein [Candidatus Acidoferrales bacterium]